MKYGLMNSSVILALYFLKLKHTYCLYKIKCAWEKNLQDCLYIYRSFLHITEVN